MLLPRLPVPALAVDTVAHGAFDLSTETPENFTLVVFYRGLHCPLCAKYLLELERLVPEFEKRGVSVIALSSDDAECAAAMARAFGIRSAAAADCAVAVAGAVSIPPVTRATCGCRRTSMDAPATGLPSTYNCARTTGPGRAGTVSMLRMSITFATCGTGGGRPSMSMIARPVPVEGRAPAGCSRPIRVPAGTGSGSSSATRPMLPCATTRRPMLSATVRSSRRRLAAFDAALFVPSARPALASPADALSPAATGSRWGMPPTPLMLRSARAS